MRMIYHQKQMTQLEKGLKALKTEGMICAYFCIELADLKAFKGQGPKGTDQSNYLLLLSAPQEAESGELKYPAMKKSVLQKAGVSPKGKVSKGYVKKSGSKYLFIDTEGGGIAAGKFKKGMATFATSWKDEIGGVSVLSKALMIANTEDAAELEEADRKALGVEADTDFNAIVDQITKAAGGIRKNKSLLSDVEALDAAGAEVEKALKFADQLQKKMLKEAKVEFLDNSDLETALSELFGDSFELDGEEVDISELLDLSMLWSAKIAFDQTFSKVHDDVAALAKLCRAGWSYDIGELAKLKEPPKSIPLKPHPSLIAIAETIPQVLLSDLWNQMINAAFVEIQAARKALAAALGAQDADKKSVTPKIADWINAVQGAEDAVEEWFGLVMADQALIQNLKQHPFSDSQLSKHALYKTMELPKITISSPLPILAPLKNGVSAFLATTNTTTARLNAWQAMLS